MGGRVLQDLVKLMTYRALRLRCAALRICARPKEHGKPPVRFVVIPESKNRWVWELRSTQDFLVLTSPAGFTTKSQAVAQIEALRRAIHMSGIYDLVGARLDPPREQPSS